MSEQEQEVKVLEANLLELGRMFSTGLEYDLPQEVALGKIVEKYENQKIVTQAYVPEKPAIPDKGIEATPAVPEESFLITPENQDRLLGAIAGLPALRAEFAESIADKINSARAESAEYKKMIASLEKARAAVVKAREDILALDESFVPGFSITEFVDYASTGSVEPKDFARQPIATKARRKKAKSRVGWTEDEYDGGNVGEFTGVRLIRNGSEWDVYSDQGFIVTEHSPHAAMKALLELCGLATSRAATRFWNAAEAEGV